MGALFSSEPEVPKRAQYPVYTYREEEERLREYIRQNTPTRPTPTSTYAYNHTNSAYRTSNINSYGYESPVRTSTAVAPSVTYANNYNSSTRVTPSKTVISSADYSRFQQKVYSAVLNQCRVLNWRIVTGSAEYQLITLESYSREYLDICSKFMRGVVHDENYKINVSKIERVQNPYLMGQYYFKKLEYKNKNLQAPERLLFHGTKKEHIDNICKDNFNWRLHGTTKGNIFGKGVSFTPKSPYANHYCDRKLNSKVMIVAKVIVSRSCPGNEFMKIPPYYDANRLLRFDTSIKEPKKDVLVKYSDDEFYPAYLVHYSGKMYYNNKGFSR